MINDIYIGAGCFWGTQAYYKKIKGIITADSGYANGPSDKTTYKEVCESSGHAEVVKVSYDSDLITKQELFDSFIRIIDPYSLNKQHEDEGMQYRTGLYFTNEDLMNEYKELLNVFEKENKKTEVEILDLINYVDAEEYHQDYLEKNPKGYCHINLMNIPEYLLK